MIIVHVYVKGPEGSVVKTHDFLRIEKDDDLASLDGRILYMEYDDELGRIPTEDEILNALYYETDLDKGGH